jgi:hypothetical protein
MTDATHRDAYIDLVKRAITNHLYLGGESTFDAFRCVTHYDLKQSNWKIDPHSRPLTLLTKKQLDLIEGCVLEAGIWRGGAIVLLRALLNAHGIEDRKIYAADSFAGIPKNAADRNDPVDNWKDRWVASLPKCVRTSSVSASWTIVSSSPSVFSPTASKRSPARNSR